MICKTLHRKLNIEQQESYKQPRVKSGAPKGWIVHQYFTSRTKMFLLICKQLFH